jgi:PIN domain nuclease of toxin-antitoxin system
VRLSPAAEDAIGDGDSFVAVSAATAWELAIKAAKKRLRFPPDLLEQLEQHGFVPLSISVSHALAAGQLPAHHSDPFDRMLVAQAKLEDLTLVTRDERLAAYGVAVLPA